MIACILKHGLPQCIAEYMSILLYISDIKMLYLGEHHKNTYHYSFNDVIHIFVKFSKMQRLNI